MNIEILGWIATAILLVGYYLNAKKYITSFIIWFIGNALMGIYAYVIESFSVVALSIVLMVLNLYGYNNWKSDK